MEKPKILVIGENPDNHSGFGKLHSLIIDLLVEEKFNVTSIALMATSGKSIERNAVEVINNIDYVQNEFNAWGYNSILRYLSEHKDCKLVLMTGDPWWYDYIKILKPLFNNVTFIYYCPSEGDEFPKYIINPNSKTEINCRLDEVFNAFDYIIPYTEMCKLALENLMPSLKEVKILEPCLHWIPEFKNIQPKPIESLENILKDKFVIGFIGRNSFRKGTDLIPNLVKTIAKKSSIDMDKFVFLLHIPKMDPFGYDYDNISHYFDDEILSKLIFVEDYHLSCYNAAGQRSVKVGISDEELEYLYSKLNTYVSLSRAEGVGFTVIEAISRGIPTVINGYAGPQEIHSKIDKIRQELNQGFISCKPSSRYIYQSGINTPMAEPDLNLISDAIIDIIEHYDRHLLFMKNYVAPKANDLFINGNKCFYKNEFAKAINTISKNTIDKLLPVYIADNKFEKEYMDLFKNECKSIFISNKPLYGTISLSDNIIKTEYKLPVLNINNVGVNDSICVIASSKLTESIIEILQHNYNNDRKIELGIIIDNKRKGEALIIEKINNLCDERKIKRPTLHHSKSITQTISYMSQYKFFISNEFILTPNIKPIYTYMAISAGCIPVITGHPTSLHYGNLVASSTVFSFVTEDRMPLTIRELSEALVKFITNDNAGLISEATTKIDNYANENNITNFISQQGK